MSYKDVSWLIANHHAVLNVPRCMIQNDLWAVEASHRSLKKAYETYEYCRWVTHRWSQIATRQSEMANTSPRHMPVLGNVHPITIENFDIFSWRHFTARSSFYIINWYGYPRGSHERYLKEIVSPVFEIRHWIVTC